MYPSVGEYVNVFGLLLNFLGSLMIGLSAQFGFAGGWGGVIQWRSSRWKYTNCIGWVVLTMGFLLQLLAQFASE